MVVAARAADRFEHVVDAREHLGRETPARAEHEELGRTVGAEPAAERRAGQPPRTLAGAGRDELRQAAGLPLDVGDGRVEVVCEPDERQRLLPRLVVAGAGAGLPVAADALDQPAERRHGSGDVDGSYVAGAAEAAAAVAVYVRQDG